MLAFCSFDIDFEFQSDADQENLANMKWNDDNLLLPPISSSDFETVNLLTTDTNKRKYDEIEFAFTDDVEYIFDDCLTTFADEGTDSKPEHNDKVEKYLTTVVKTNNRNKRVEQITLVGIVLTAFTYIGTVSFSKERWIQLSNLYNKAIVKQNKASAKPTQIQRWYKKIKSEVKCKETCLKTMYESWKKLNEDKTILTNQDFELELCIKTNLNDQKKTKVSNSPRKNAWDETQNCILFGSICEYVFSNGTLNTTNDNNPWKEIKKTYDERNFELATFDVERKLNAIKRHLKEMRNCAIYEKDETYMTLFFRNLYEDFQAQNVYVD